MRESTLNFCIGPTRLGQIFKIGCHLTWSSFLSDFPALMASAYPANQGRMWTSLGTMMGRTRWSAVTWISSSVKSWNNKSLLITNETRSSLGFYIPQLSNYGASNVTKTTTCLGLQIAKVMTKRTKRRESDFINIIYCTLSTLVLSDWTCENFSSESREFSVA